MAKRQFLIENRFRSTTFTFQFSRQLLQPSVKGLFRITEPLRHHKADLHELITTLLAKTQTPTPQA
jgi:hypothetical protein